MSSQASEAELYRILSGEKDLERNSGYEEHAPCGVTDTAYFDYVGALFGPRKDSCPDYPDCVDLHDSEAAKQPDSAKPCSYYTRQLRPTPTRTMPHSPPTPTLTPTLTPTQKGPYLWPMEYKALNSRRLAQARGKRSVRSGRTHESTPAQSRDPSPTTTTGYNHQADDIFLRRDATPEDCLDRGTPSHHSFASDENENHHEGLGPFPPQPFTTYNLYKTLDNTNDAWGPVDAWQPENSHSLSEPCTDVS